jgi:hypothetical protein
MASPRGNYSISRTGRCAAVNALTATMTAPARRNISFRFQATKRELVRAFLNYLGVEDAAGAAKNMEEEQMAAMKRWRERSSQPV